MDVELEILQEEYIALAKEISGFITAHQFAIRSDGGNSNIAVMEFRLKEAKEMFPDQLEKITTEFS
jgi:hypothetical protein